MSTPAKDTASSTQHRHINNLNRDSADYIFYLQRAIGNQAVQRLMRPKETEFDLARITLQPKLKASQPDDANEQEADKVAEQVMRMPASSNLIKSTETTKDEGIINRKCAACEMKDKEEDEKRMNISRKPSSTLSNLEADDETANEIDNIRTTNGGGSSLDPSTKEFMESRFGYDFNKVRIHTDNVAARSANSVNALAYTVGNDIVFAEGQYQTGTESGKKLLAHELTHVAQQDSNPSSNPISRKAAAPKEEEGGEETVQMCVSPPDPNGEWTTENWLYEMRREPRGSNRRLLATGGKGRSVELLHQALMAWQCQYPEESTHGIPISEYESAEYREGTREVVRDFQKWAGGLARDGIVGPSTIEIFDYKVVGGPPHVSEAPSEAESSDVKQDSGLQEEAAATNEMKNTGSDLMWSKIVGERSIAVGKMARVRAPLGVRLRSRPAPGASNEVILPFDELVQVQRKTDYGWCWVVSMGKEYTGKTGFCEEQFLSFDPPEPTAHLYPVQPGDTLGAIATSYYGKSMDEENNARLYVQALYIANKGHAGVYLDEVDLGLEETLLRSGKEEETLKIYKSAKVRKGMVIWVPSAEFVAHLKARGLVTSGSTEVMKAWREVKEIVSDIIWGAKYVAGFIVGLLEGAWNAIVDLFKGAADMIETVAEVLYHLITGNPGAIKDKLMGWVEMLKKAWEHRDKIADDFMKKWEAEDGWDRGKFHGEVLGWVIMTVLIVIVTAGAGALAQIPGKWASVVRVLRALDALGDVTTYIGATVKLPSKVTRAVRRELGAAEEVLEAPLEAGKATQKVGADLVGASKPVLGGRHKLLIRRIGNRLVILLCSNGCGDVIAKAEAMLARLPKTHPARNELHSLINDAKRADTWVNDALDAGVEGAKEELEKLRKTLDDIQTKYPDAVDPNIHVPPATTAPSAERVPTTEPIATPAPPVGDVWERLGLSLRGLDPDLTLETQLRGTGQLEDLMKSPNLKGVGAADLPKMTPRQLAQMVEDGKITKRVFDSIMKTGEGRDLGGGGHH